MNSMMKKIIHVLMTGLMLAVFAAVPAFGQADKTPDVVLPLATPTPVRGDPRPPGDIKPQVICVYRREPIPFRPFEMRDPITGAPVGPTTPILVLKGKKGEKVIPAGIYYDYINGYERQLSELGYSLRDALPRGDGNDDPFPQPDPPIVLQRTCINEQAMQFQTSSIEAKHVKPPQGVPLITDLTPELMTALVAEHQRMTLLDPARLKRIESGKRCDIAADFEEEKKKEFNFDLGDRDTFYVGINGYLLLAPKRDPLEVTIEGEAKAVAAVLGSDETTLIKAFAKAHAVKDGELTAEITLDVLGKSVWNPSLPPEASSWSKTDTFTRSFEYSQDFHFTLGPIPMVARVGVQGDASLKYFVGLRPFTAHADLNPSVNSKAYVEAAVDLLIAEAGAGGELTLINDKLNFAAEIGIDADDKGIFYYRQFSGTNEFSALGGRLYLYAKIDVPWPFSDKKYEYELWKWAGFNTKGTLFDIQSKKYLFYCPPNDAKFISQSVPGTMTAGQRYLVSVTMLNTGQNTWVASQGYKLGSWNPENNTTWGFSRVELPLDANRQRVSVAPGGQVTFSFYVTAPSASGLHRFQWRMLREGAVGWFGDSSRRAQVGTINGTLMATPNPIRVCDGSGKGEATLSWHSDSPELEVRVGAPNGTLLAKSGQSGSAATGKVADGTVFYLQNVMSGLPLTAINTLATVKISLTTSGCPPNNAAFVSQSVPSVMTSGQSYEVRVTLKNTGTNTWNAGRAYRLGSDYPPDNMVWGLSRVELPINLNDPARQRISVPPGGQVTFTFTVKAPRVPAPTPFFFQWRMVQDGVEWFGEPTTLTPVVVMP